MLLVYVEKRGPVSGDNGAVSIPGRPIDRRNNGCGEFPHGLSHALGNRLYLCLSDHRLSCLAVLAASAASVGASSRALPRLGAFSVWI